MLVTYPYRNNLSAYVAGGGQRHTGRPASVPVEDF